YDIWPINIEGGPEFLFFFFFASASALAAAWALGWLASMVLESGEADGIRVDPPPPPHGAPPYRNPGAFQGRRRLAKGWIPQAEDVWPIAWLRDREDGVAETLLAAAVALGWVRG